tara:strand:- start:255 stop:506 length:252 start_codon:yes stop_codon:yes gene_type:complete
VQIQFFHLLLQQVVEKQVVEQMQVQVLLEQQVVQVVVVIQEDKVVQVILPQFLLLKEMQAEMELDLLLPTHKILEVVVEVQLQ